MRLWPSKSQPQPRLDFGEYLDGLYGYAMALSQNPGKAEDLVQETCLRALRSMDGLRGNGSRKSWLFTILRNIWLNQLRHQRTVREHEELYADGSEPNEPADPAQDPHTDFVSKLERERVRMAIQQLPLEFREIIILREYEELSYQDIAALLDCPVGTVMSRLARARSRLRALLLAGASSPPVEKNGSSRPMRVQDEDPGRETFCRVTCLTEGMASIQGLQRFPVPAQEVASPESSGSPNRASVSLVGATRDRRFAAWSVPRARTRRLRASCRRENEEPR